MEISIFTDEIDKQDYIRALNCAVSWGIKRIEVRAINGVRLPRVARGVRDAFIRRVRDLGLSVSGLSPGFFKCDLEDPEVRSTFDEDLPDLCETANLWGSPLITCFSFRRRDGVKCPQLAVDLLGRAADRVTGSGCELVVENVAGCWGATGSETGAIIRQVGAGRLGLCWDPGNAARGGAREPFPDDYDTVRDLVKHVHVKNCLPDRHGWGLVDDGIVDWGAQLGALKKDGYKGLLVIETHLTERPPGRPLGPLGTTPLEMNTLDNLVATRACLDVQV